LYVVRELTRKRVWFAEPLLSSATEEVRRLIVVARQSDLPPLFEQATPYNSLGALVF
jgi:hypothetical protein